MTSGNLQHLSLSTAQHTSCDWSEHPVIDSANSLFQYFCLLQAYATRDVSGNAKTRESMQRPASINKNQHGGFTWYTVASFASIISGFSEYLRE
jgi:hypothetical protein